MNVRRIMLRCLSTLVLAAAALSPRVMAFEGATLLDVQVEAAQFVHDPLGYVYWAYPWGTDALPMEGPDRWQESYLRDLGHALRENNGGPNVVMTAVGGANGVGKTAVIAWLLEWGKNTWEMTRGKVTANTATQLRLVTWAELARWHGLSIAKDLSSLQAT